MASSDRTVTRSTSCRAATSASPSRTAPAFPLRHCSIITLMLIQDVIISGLERYVVSLTGISVDETQSSRHGKIGAVHDERDHQCLPSCNSRGKWKILASSLCHDIVSPLKLGGQSRRPAGATRTWEMCRAWLESPVNVRKMSLEPSTRLGSSVTTHEATEQDVRNWRQSSRHNQIALT